MSWVLESKSLIWPFSKMLCSLMKFCSLCSAPYKTSFPILLLIRMQFICKLLLCQIKVQGFLIILVILAVCFFTFFYKRFSKCVFQLLPFWIAKRSLVLYGYVPVLPEAVRIYRFFHCVKKMIYVLFLLHFECLYF